MKQGDCLELLKDISDGSIDLIVTDPPYDIPQMKGSGTYGHYFDPVREDCQAINILNGFDKRVLDECWRVMKKPNIYLWCNARQIPMYLDFFVDKRGCSFDILVWIKDNAMPTYSNKYLTDKEYCLYFRKGGYCQPEDYKCARTWFMQPINAKDKALYKHPTIKPMRIIHQLVKNSCPEGGVVLDPFMGSGTTGVACAALNRDFIGIELNEEYFKIAETRINNQLKELTLF